MSALRIGQTFTDWRDIPKGMHPCVYCLVDPREPNRPRYVGVTKNPWKRMQGHWATSHQHDTEAWKASLLAAGVKCAVRIVAVFETTEEAHRAEWRIAARWRRRGVKLLGEHRPPAFDFQPSAPSAWADEPYPTSLKRSS